MKDIVIIDNEVPKTDLNEFILSILCLENGLSFSLYSTTNNKIHNLIYRNKTVDQSFPEFLTELCNEFNLRDKNYKQVKIMISSNKAIFVPDAFFCIDNFESYLKFNYSTDDTESIKYKLINQGRSFLVYSIKRDLLKSFENLFPDAEIQSHAETFIRHNLKRSLSSEDESGDKVYIQVHDNFADILIIRNKELFFYNTFIKSGINELQYHVLNVFDQMKLSQEKTEVIISGFIEQNDIAVIHLKKFIRLLYFESVNRDYNYFYKFQDIMPHYFFNFLNINK